MAWAMLSPPMRQERTAGFSRVPPQSGQGPVVVIGSSSCRWSLPSSLRMMLRYMRVISPSYLAVLGHPWGGFFRRIWGE